MPLTISCISKDIKTLLSREIQDKETLKLLDSLRTCPEGDPLLLSEEKRRAKRKASEYNLFIGACVKKGAGDTPVSQRFKACAQQWREGPKGALRLMA